LLQALGLHDHEHGHAHDEAKAVVLEDFTAKMLAAVAGELSLLVLS